MDFCAGLCPMANACMLLEHHRTFVRCDLDSTVLSAAEPDFLLTFAFQMLNPNSDTTEGEEGRAVAPGFKGKAAVLSARKKATAWEMPSGLDARQVMHGHTLPFFCTLYDGCRLYKRCRHI